MIFRQNHFTMMRMSPWVVLFSWGCSASSLNQGKGDAGDDTEAASICTEVGSTRCAGVVVQSCVGGRWEDSENCQTQGRDCVSTAGGALCGEAILEGRCDKEDLCGVHGTCNDSGVVITCACEEGWGGATCGVCAPGFHTDQGDCVLDESCLSTSCTGNGTCDDTTGIVVCTCNAGYSDTYCESCDTGYHSDAKVCVADESCALSIPCGDHGTCDDTDGAVSCTCDMGWAGDICEMCADGHHFEEGDCVLDQTCLTTSCSGHGICSDEGNDVACLCDTGYAAPYCQECVTPGYHWEQGSCVANQICAVDDAPCVHGSCDDTGGIVTCTCDEGWAVPLCSTCASGYHVEGESCVLDEQCLQTSCFAQGVCDDSTGVVRCTCEDGYIEPYCAACDTGYHLEGTDCVADEACAVASPCGNHGTCSDDGGVVICTCDVGWKGDACNICLEGYHLSGDQCALDQQCMPNSCDGHGTCSDADGVVECSCDIGYTGSYCSSCDTEFHAEGIDCLADESCSSNNPCGNHGDCTDIGGVIVCTCDKGWVGDTCNGCSAGYHLDGQACVLDQSCLTSSCFGHGDCSVSSSGLVQCSCDTGYTGTYCAVCSANHHWEENLCVPNEVCGAGDAPCVNGSCADTTGVVACTCDAGWGDDFCDICAGGYHEVGGACLLDESCVSGSCSYHGACSQSGGVISCSCNLGYNPATYCATCASGYHYDVGVCVPNETCTPNPCGANGSCSVVGGEAICACNAGYAGATCAACASGFQDNDHNGTCTIACSLGVLTCTHGSCSDTNGTAQCVCDVGWEDTLCTICSEDAYEDNDYDTNAYEPGGDFSATLAACGTDADWFAIDLLVGNVITATATFTYSLSGNIDVFLWYLYDDSPIANNLIDASEGLIDDTESVSHTVLSGEAGKYLVEVRGAGAFVRNTYNLQITIAGP